MSGRDYNIGRLRGELAIVFYEGDERKRRRFTLGTKDRAVAEARARAFWTERTRQGRDWTIADIMNEYLPARASVIRSAERQKYAWARLEPYWGNMKPHLIDRDACLDYAKSRDVKPATVLYELCMLRAALNWAVDEKIIDKAPKITTPSVPKSERERLTKAEFRRFLDQCHAPHVRLFAVLAASTGARMTALLELTWSRVDMDARLIYLNPFQNIERGKRRATVPISDQAYEALAEAREGALTDYVIEYGGDRVRSVKKGIGSAARRAGLYVTPHMFRHSAATWMAEARVPMAEIANFLGHGDSRITERIYAKFSPDYMRSAVSAVAW